jgi:hypothetical protein
VDLSNGYDGVEQTQTEEGNYDSEPDAGVEVRQITGDDVRYGDVEVEEDEIDYEYDEGDL